MFQLNLKKKLQSKIHKIAFYLLIILLALTAQFTIANAQGNPNNVREVYSEEYIQYHFAVPEGTNIDSLHELDFARMMLPDEERTTLYKIGRNLETTITTTFNKLPFGDFAVQNEVGSSIQNSEGVDLYDSSGGHVYHLDNDSLHAKWSDPLTGYNSIQEFGLTPLLKAPTALEINELTNKGYVISIDSNNVLTAIANDHELILDPNDLTIVNRYFEEFDLVLVLSSGFASVSNNYMVPAWRIEKHYETLFSGIEMEVTKVHSFLKYETYQSGIPEYMYNSDNNPIARKGTEIQMFEKAEKLNSQLKVFPNPATDQLNIVVPTFESDLLNIQVLDQRGKVVESLRRVPAGIEFPININNYSAGVYMLRCGIGNQWQSVKFIKQ